MTVCMILLLVRAAWVLAITPRVVEVDHLVAVNLKGFSNPVMSRHVWSISRNDESLHYIDGAPQFDLVCATLANPPNGATVSAWVSPGARGVHDVYAVSINGRALLTYGESSAFLLHLQLIGLVKALIFAALGMWLLVRITRSRPALPSGP